MGRCFMDAELQEWEAFASAAREATRPRIVFRSLSEPMRRPRMLPWSGHHADAERAVSEADAAELRQWLGDATDLT